MAQDLLGSALSWLATQQLANTSVAATFRRGASEVELRAIPGDQIHWPYNGAELPPTGMSYFLPVADLVIASAAIVPRDGDQLDVGDRTFELVSLGGAAPAELAQAGSLYKVTGLDVTDSLRRDTLVNVEVPGPVPEKNAYGEVARDLWRTIFRDIYVTIFADGGSESTVGGKLAGVGTVRVNMAARDIPLSARIWVRDGWLEDRYLFVQSISRDSVNGQETNLVCRLTGLGTQGGE